MQQWYAPAEHPENLESEVLQNTTVLSPDLLSKTFFISLQWRISHLTLCDALWSNYRHTDK
jgi:hypothetical protein